MENIPKRINNCVIKLGYYWSLCDWVALRIPKTASCSKVLEINMFEDLNSCVQFFSDLNLKVNFLRSKDMRLSCKLTVECYPTVIIYNIEEVDNQ